MLRAAPLIILLSCTGKSPLINYNPDSTDTSSEPSQDTSVSEPGSDPSVTDSDGDGVVDAEDACPNGIGAVDTDGDGICDEEDPCPTAPSNLDSDGDGVCDEDDACPEDPNETQDSDLDTICDGEDACPENPLGAVDSDGDGDCDDDDDNDGDGLSNGQERSYGEDCSISNPNESDTDEDGVSDSQDPYPRDPWPEFILNRNENGTIDLMLSNRDGSFEPVVEVGWPYGDTANSDYRYTHFSISDFDDNGKMDFLAVGQDIDNPGNVDVWYFWREKADELNQRLLGNWSRNPLSVAADVDNDERIDLLGAEISRPNYVESMVMHSFLNKGLVHSANCFATEDPANPNGCAFVHQLAVDLSSWASGQWVVRHSRSAVDVTGDGFRDFAVLKIQSGGNSANVPVTIVPGNGDGTFGAPLPSMVNHNTNSCGGSPSNMVLFGDFNQDNLGDIITGLDDDGDAGSAWFYPGQMMAQGYGINPVLCVESFDINPAAESGAENFGNTNAVTSFDVDFDGIKDIVIGYRDTDPWQGSSRIELLFGNGDGTFAVSNVIATFTDNGGMRFATPQRVCERFPL